MLYNYSYIYTHIDKYTYTKKLLYNFLMMIAATICAINFHNVYGCHIKMYLL